MSLFISLTVPPFTKLQRTRTHWCVLNLRHFCIQPCLQRPQPSWTPTLRCQFHYPSFFKLQLCRLLLSSPPRCSVSLQCLFHAALLHALPDHAARREYLPCRPLSLYLSPQQLFYCVSTPSVSFVPLASILSVHAACPSCRDGPGPDADKKACTYSMVWRRFQCRQWLWRRLQCRQCVNDGGPKELAGHMEWSMCLIPRTKCRQTTLIRFSYGETRFGTDQSASDVVVCDMVR